MYQDIKKHLYEMYFAHAIGPYVSRARSLAEFLKTRFKQSFQPEIVHLISLNRTICERNIKQVYSPLAQMEFLGLNSGEKFGNRNGFASLSFEVRVLTFRSPAGGSCWRPRVSFGSLQ